MSIQQLTHDTFPTFVEQMDGATLLGLDTEFHAERRYTPLLLLVQIQIPDADTWIIDPTKPIHIPSLRECLLDKAWVVHGGRFDLILLNLFLGDLPPLVWDTQIAAGLLELKYPAPYGHLVEKYLGLCLPKQGALSNWTQRPLTELQLQYAAEDVIHLIPLWHSLQHALNERTLMSAAKTLCMHRVT